MKRSWPMLAVLALFIVPTFACSPTPANAAPVSPAPFVARDVSPSAAADSITYLVRWSAVSDANGAATGYVDTVRAGTALVHAHAGVGLVDTVRVAVPAIGTNTTFTACVRAVRRGLSSAGGCVMWTASTADVPPPSPSPSIDSSLVKPVSAFLTSPAQVGNQIMIAAGDSAMVTMHYVMASGDTVLAFKSVAWTTSDSAIAIPHPVLGTASTWIAVPLSASSRLTTTGGVYAIALR